MEQIKPTRSELLRTKKRVKLAKKGHELLKKKQDSLIIEFFSLLREVKSSRVQLQEHYGVAVTRLNQARALTSDLTIRASALAVQQAAPIQLHVKNIAGVKVPEIERETASGEQPKYSSLLLREVGQSYKKVVDAILLLAAKETALRKLLEEIKKTKRRAHALEHVRIPQLSHAVQYIRFELEEREREEFARLKHKKQ